MPLATSSLRIPAHENRDELIQFRRITRPLTWLRQSEQEATLREVAEKPHEF